MYLDPVELGCGRGVLVSHMGVAFAVSQFPYSPPPPDHGILGLLMTQVDVWPLCAGPGSDTSEALSPLRVLVLPEPSQAERGKQQSTAESILGTGSTLAQRPRENTLGRANCV